MEETTTRRSWFSGAFTYALPKGWHSAGGLGRLRREADRLGLDPDLDTIWNAAPWTWAVDWVTNVGDLITNVNDIAKYGLVVQYGYVMTHTKVTRTYTSTDWYTRMGPVGSSRNVPAPPVTLVTEEKVRTPATPFGFGVDTSSLDAMQYSILAALGLSRR